MTTAYAKPMDDLDAIMTVEATVIVKPRLGGVVGGSVKYGDDLFRPLVAVARRHVGKGVAQ